jgi:hypothetical protein
VIDPPDADIIWNSAQNRWEVSFDVTGFSGFIVQTLNFLVPLPLQVTLSGTRTNTVNQLSWHTANETNTREFILERSADVITFIPVVTKPAMGSGDYSYQDIYPASTKAYYRLKIIDLDGRFSFSNIIFLGGVVKGSILYPNPANDLVVLQLADRSLVNTVAVLSDISGRTIRTFLLKHMTVTVDIAGLPSGIYLVRLSDNSVLKFLKE